MNKTVLRTLDKLLADGQVRRGFAVAAKGVKCDLDTSLDGIHGTAVVDGATRMGIWANMCRACFVCVGIGLGPGGGQVILDK